MKKKITTKSADGKTSFSWWWDTAVPFQAALRRILEKKLVLLIAMLFLVGCTIPVVGNSPEEIKHRQSVQRDDTSTQPQPGRHNISAPSPAESTTVFPPEIEANAYASEPLSALAEKIQKRDGTNFIGQYLGMIAEHSYGPPNEYDHGHSVMMYSATSGELLRWISYEEFRQVYVFKTRPEYLPSK